MTKHRRTLSDMASEAAEDAGGVACPKCGCRDLRAYGTNRSQSVTFRYRACRNCGHRVLTATRPNERIVRDVDPQGEGEPSGILKLA